MRLASGDVRDHIVSHKNDHGPSYRRYGALLRQRRQKINFRGIFGPVRFSTFATVSAKSGSRSPILTTSFEHVLVCWYPHAHRLTFN